ncbi:hypothetical protein [Rhizobium sp. SU303]|uniref:hypothetical protein n=1 Tax=Rhizobium sp. SU303 TaxID=3138065 RepID=UPI001E5593AF|nr:hypothetical protein [Rhizobium leguminosarum]UFW80047.1 hypothetical protein RlegSU303_09045 [Rhizobium leguminosarum bv. viciae]
MAAMAVAVPAMAAPQTSGFLDQTIIWLRDRFMQEAQRFLSGNTMNLGSAERMGRLARVMSELPARSDNAIAAKRSVSEWEGRIEGGFVSYDAMTKFALVASIRRDETGGSA